MEYVILFFNCPSFCGIVLAALYLVTLHNSFPFSKYLGCSCLALINLSRKDGPGWSQSLFPRGASPELNFMHRLCSLRFHFSCPQEKFTTLPPPSAVTNPGPAVTASLSWNSFPECSPSSFGHETFLRSRKASVIHSISALGRGAFSVVPVNLKVYLGNNLTALLPLATGTQRLGGFCVLLAGKSQDFCAHAWFPYPVCVEPGCLGALRALRSARVLRGFQNSQTELNPDFPHPPGLAALAASIAGRAKPQE